MSFRHHSLSTELKETVKTCQAESKGPSWVGLLGVLVIIPDLPARLFESHPALCVTTLWHVCVVFRGRLDHDLTGPSVRRHSCSSRNRVWKFNSLLHKNTQTNTESVDATAGWGLTLTRPMWCSLVPHCQMIFELAAVLFGLDFDFCFNTGWLNASLLNRTDETQRRR